MGSEAFVPFDEVCLQRLRKASYIAKKKACNNTTTAMGTENEKQKGTVPFYYSYVWKNVSLFGLSLLCLPVSAVLVLFSLLVQRINGRDKVLQAERRSIAVTQRKTILVTGVSMTKGLSIARVLSENTQHRVIGADISPFSPGRFSSAITKYHRLDTPNGDNAEPYIDSILSVILNEKVDLWISCSSVIAAVEDGQVVRLAQQQAKKVGRRFEAIQFNEDVVEKFHEKDKFIDYISTLGLLIPESHRITSSDEALKVLLQNVSNPGKREITDKKFIMKPIGVDDHARNAMMTLLPFDSPSQTKKYIQNLNISASNPFQLQQFINGNEYCTHALVIRGKVKAFCSCPSLELLMHYEPLPAYSKLNQEMLAFTERVVADGGNTFTGHLSFDFLVEDEENVKLYPIECNPRAHTAVVLFEKTPEMAEAYLSALDYRKDSGELEKPIFPRTPTSSYYWFGHDLVSFVILPFLDAVFGAATWEDCFSGVATFWHHFSSWKDGTLTIADPWPFFVLYHVYWPARFLECLYKGKAWSR
jgi:hypothetical protein